MFKVRDIHSLTDFQRHTKTHLKTLERTGQPEILTINGKAKLVVQEAESYQKLLELVDRMDAIEGIKRGLLSMKRGEGKPARQVFERLERKFKASLSR